ncbi:MAG: ComF family protein [Chromatiales bacterium]|nr:ComF family protein [Chromatiales bacterium]
MTWKRVDQVLAALFPVRCLLCGQATGDLAPVCPGCRGDLPWIDPRNPGPGVIPGVHVRCALRYEYPVDRLVAAAKFGRQLPVARGLGQLLAAGMPPLAEPPDAVVPVPLHWRREADRGFNQAEEIARGLCDDRGWPLRADLCRRVRPTPEQSGLGAAHRRQNLEGAFALVNPRALARCGHILLVDDVLTTGATVAALSGLFLAAGVQQLSVWTAAYTPPPADQVAARKV